MQSLSPCDTTGEDPRMMKTLCYRVRFTTPAFLGNAAQSGQWRTPPFKALLRQWWRVVWAERHDFQEDVATMRRDEDRLFGGASPDDFRKSAVRLRLDTWAGGTATESQWGHQDDDNAAKVDHPEVGRRVGSLLYLGYGPLKFARNATVLKSNAAIQADETATLSIAAPESNVEDIRDAVVLMHQYGTVGGRGRNGWGSLVIEPSANDRTMARQEQPESRSHRFSRPWGHALKLGWPHAIGVDGTGLLVWRTAQLYDHWKPLMHDLAILKIGLRTMFVFPNVRPPHPRPLQRHWLSHPITKHGNKAWNGSWRLPNSLRFKVRPDEDDARRVRGVIFHVPCRPPAAFEPNADALSRVWEKTHQLLDELTCPSNQRRYGMIDDHERRDELKRSLDRLDLQRSIA